MMDARTGAKDLSGFTPEIQEEIQGQQKANVGHALDEGLTPDVKLPS